MVTGGKDLSVRVWRLGEGTLKGSSLRNWARAPLPFCPLHILHGHTAEVTCLAACSDLDIVVSGGADCYVLLYKMSKGRYVRSVRHTCPVTQVLLTSAGDIIVCGRQDNHLLLMDVNGW